MEYLKSEIEVGLKLQITAQQAWNYRIIPDSYEAGRIKIWGKLMISRGGGCLSGKTRLTWPDIDHGRAEKSSRNRKSFKFMRLFLMNIIKYH